MSSFSLTLAITCALALRARWPASVVRRFYFFSRLWVHRLRNVQCWSKLQTW